MQKLGFQVLAKVPDPVTYTLVTRNTEMILDGKVSAAILPTPIVAQQMTGGAGLAMVLATDPIPHLGLSAAPSIDAATRNALLSARTREDGQKMLKQVGFERFDPASAALYAGQGNMLKEYWRY